MKVMTYRNPMTAFDSIFGGDPFQAFAPLLEAPRKQTSGTEWFADDANYYARVELPGIGKKDLSLDFEADIVTFIFNSRKTDENGESIRHERKLRVPEGIDASAITAELKDGVLTLVLPKIPATEPTRIEIA